MLSGVERVGSSGRGGDLSLLDEDEQPIALDRRVDPAGELRLERHDVGQA